MTSPDTSADGVAAVSLSGVHFSYGNGDVLQGVDVEIPQGTFTAFIGPNGAGKSTALKVMLGLLKPTSGQVEIFGRPPEAGAETVGWVPQHARIPSGVPLSAHEVVVMGRYSLVGVGRRAHADDHARAEETLIDVGLGGKGEHRFDELSGGQQRRVLIARALVGEPRILLLDEATAGLDPAARARLYTLVCDLQRARGLTVVCASHDIEDVSVHADRLILLDRKVLASGPPNGVLESPLLEKSYAFPLPHDHHGGVHGHRHGSDLAGGTDAEADAP